MSELASAQSSAQPVRARTRSKKKTQLLSRCWAKILVHLLVHQKRQTKYHFTRTCRVLIAMLCRFITTIIYETKFACSMIRRCILFVYLYVCMRSCVIYPCAHKSLYIATVVDGREINKKKIKASRFVCKTKLHLFLSFYGIQFKACVRNV